MSRIKLKKRHIKIKLKDKIVITIICIIISVICVFNIFNKRVEPLFMEYAEIEVEKLIVAVVNTSVNNEVSKDPNMDNLFKDSSYTLNSKVLNNLLYNSLKSVKENLKYLEKGEVNRLNIYNNIYEDIDKEKLRKGIIFEVPSGIIFNNRMLENVFPKIPIKLEVLGSIAADIDTNIEEYGINSALFRIDLNIHANVKILLPFTSKSKKIDTKIPIVVKLVEGDVPSYYFKSPKVN